MPDETKDCACENTCDNCNACQDCDSCSCVKCPGCEKKVDRVCSRCDNCAECGCCECAYCEKCDSPVESTCSRCNQCEKCCPCSHCENCSEPYEFTCQNDYCEDCCSNNCTTCGHCGEHVERECQYCGYGTRCCCECDEESENEGPRQSQKFKIKKPATLTGFKHNASRRPVSIELELCSVSSPNLLIEWAKQAGAGLVEDGSLTESGVEINTNPASGDIFIQDARSLATVLEKADASVDDSCGLHVHVDASDYSQYDLRRLVLMWTIAEPIMFELAGYGRISNTYCKPCAETYARTVAHGVKDWRKNITRTLYKTCDKDSRAMKREKYGDARYFALNLHSYFFRRTFEFRLHEARLEAHVLENWPLLCARLVDSAMRMRESELLALVQSKRKAEDILASMLPAHLASWMREQLAERRLNSSDHVLNMLALLETGRKLLASDTVLADPITEETPTTPQNGILISRYHVEYDAETGITSYVQSGGN